jgi:hypothetical protein
LNALRDEEPDGIVDGKAVGDISAGGIHVKRDGLPVVVRQFPQPLDHCACAVFFDITDEVDITQPVRLFSADDVPNCVDKFVQQPIADVAHSCPGSLARLVPTGAAVGERLKVLT